MQLERVLHKVRIFFRDDYYAIKQREALNRKALQAKARNTRIEDSDYEETTSEEVTDSDESTSSDEAEEEEEEEEEDEEEDDEDGEEQEGEYENDEYVNSEVEPGDQSIVEEQDDEPQAISIQQPDTTVVAQDLISAVAQGDVEKLQDLLTIADEASLYRLCESAIRITARDETLDEELALTPLNCWDKNGKQYNVCLTYPQYKSHDDMRTHIFAVHHCPVEKILSSQKALVNLLQVLCIVCRDPDEARDAVTPDHIPFENRMEMLDMVLDAFRKNYVPVDNWLYKFAHHFVGNRWEFIKRIWYHNTYVLAVASGKTEKSHLLDIVVEIKNSYGVRQETFPEDYGNLFKLLAHLYNHGESGVGVALSSEH